MGSPDSNGDRESLLDKIPDVTPLRADGLELLEGEALCALVYDSDISINYETLSPHNYIRLDGSLKGATIGIAAFQVLSVDQLNGFSSSSLPKVKILILDANEICFEPLLLFDSPIPFTSSEPSDIDPEEIDQFDPYQ